MFLAGVSFAQTDSTDLEFIHSTFEPVTIEDSLIAELESMINLSLSFSVSDTVHVGSYKIELASISNGVSNLVFKEVYSISDLINNGYLTDWNVTIPFGPVPESGSYKVSVEVMDFGGIDLANISKHFN